MQLQHTARLTILHERRVRDYGTSSLMSDAAAVHAVDMMLVCERAWKPISNKMMIFGKHLRATRVSWDEEVRCYYVRIALAASFITCARRLSAAVQWLPWSVLSCGRHTSHAVWPVGIMLDQVHECAMAVVLCSSC